VGRTFDDVRRTFENVRRGIIDVIEGIWVWGRGNLAGYVEIMRDGY
jgi:hypothetical protein